MMIEKHTTMESTPDLTVTLDDGPTQVVDVELADGQQHEMEGSSSAQVNTVLCSRCNLWFIGILDFIRHHLQHDIEGATSCLLCSMSFSAQKLLFEHYTSFHNISVIPGSHHEGSDGDQPPHVDHSYHRPDEKEVGQDSKGDGEDCQQPSVVNLLGTIMVQAKPVIEAENDMVDSLEQAVASLNGLPDRGEDEASQNGDIQGVAVLDDVAQDPSTNLISKVPLEGEDEDEEEVAEQMSSGIPDNFAHIAQGGGVLAAANRHFATDFARDDIDAADEGNFAEKDQSCFVENYDLANRDGHYVNDEDDSDDCEIERENPIEYEEDDFRFISGLRHKQMRIANTDLVTDIGLQVFICLYCNFIDGEMGLIHHMKSVHKSILELERTVLSYDMCVPSDKVLPDDITGEEVIRLSEYHRRNLEQKKKSAYRGRKSNKIMEMGDKEVKKRYVENRVPCLCPECGKILCRKSALRTHILGVHSRSRNHLCEVCGKAFRAANQLSQHRKSHRKKLFSCELCDFESEVRTAIFEHQQLHPSKFILCHVCGTVLKSKTALARHMMVHSESRPFACTVEGCMWRFKSEALCKGHIESHNSPGQFICIECKRHFRKRHHVRRHLKTVHGKVSNDDADKHIAMDAKVMPSQEQFGRIPVTQLSKQHIVITTDEHGTPIFCEQSDELVFDSKSTPKLNLIEQHPE